MSTLAVLALLGASAFTAYQVKKSEAPILRESDPHEMVRAVSLWDRANPASSRLGATTSLPQGVMPNIKRQVGGPLYPEPLEAKYFKPPKTVVEWSDLHGKPYHQNPDGLPPITHELREHMEAENKYRGRNGPMDHHIDGFANGMFMTRRDGRWLARERAYRHDDMANENKQFGFDMLHRNMQPSTGVAALAPLSRFPYNAHVTEKPFVWWGPRGHGPSRDLRLLPARELFSLS